MKTTKLDMYDYSTIHKGDVDYEIQIFVPDHLSYSIADISTNLTASQHQVYLEGNYYLVTNVRRVIMQKNRNSEKKTLLILDAVMINREYVK